MTQAFNLAQFANYLNSSGQVSTSGLQSGIATQWTTGTGAIYYNGSVGINTATPDSSLDVNGIAGTFGTKTSAPGNGGNVRFRRDTGALQWTAGILGGAGATDYSVYNNISGSLQLNLTTAGVFAFNSGYGSASTAYGIRAWVNFNGTGTVAIRGSGNVSSITDLGTGTYRMNFSSALVDTNYATIVGFRGQWNSLGVNGINNILTTSVTVAYWDNSNYTNYDTDGVFIAIVR